MTGDQSSCCRFMSFPLLFETGLDGAGEIMVILYSFLYLLTSTPRAFTRCRGILAWTSASAERTQRNDTDDVSEIHVSNHRTLQVVHMNDDSHSVFSRILSKHIPLQKTEYICQKCNLSSLNCSIWVTYSKYLDNFYIELLLWPSNPVY